MFDRRLCVRQELHLITVRRVAANKVLWHRKKSICLAQSIVKNLCLKLLTFGDYGRSASN